MALGPSGRRATSRHSIPVLEHGEERATSTRAAINGENSMLAERIRRDRTNVRPYVRTSTQKLKWTHELHQCFMRAVDSLGGQDKATPKRIMQHMKRDGITIAHIKSHLQMFRSGKINSEGLSKSEYTTWQGGQWQSVKAGQQAGPVIYSEAAQPHSKYEELSGDSDIASAKALMQLREDSGRSSDSGAAMSELRRGSPDDQENYQYSYVHKKSKALLKLREEGAPGNRMFVVELNDKCIRNSPETRQQDLGQPSRPDPWPSPISNSSVGEASTSHPVDVTDSLSGSKRKVEEVLELNLTMATGSLRPLGFQFASPPTPEEAHVNLALS